MGVGMCLYAQLVQTNNKQCKSAIILQCYHPHLSDFCSRPRLTQPYNHIGQNVPRESKSQNLELEYILVLPKFI